MPARKTRASPHLESLKHHDKRANIPTEELRDFVADEEKQPRTIHYPRDPSLDPQLVWKGKDEQDSQDLAVPAVPIYIQEKIHPQAIIENIRAHLPSPVGALADGGGRVGAGGEDLLNLILEVSGEARKDKAAKVATARTLWVPAVNNHGGFGRWAFLEISDPWDAKNTILALMRSN